MSKISNKITNKSKITFKDLLLAIYKEVGEEKITNSHLKNIAKNLNLNLTTLKKYYEKAKEEGFITKSDTIAKKYLKQIQKDVQKDKKEDDKKISQNVKEAKAKSSKLSKIDKGQLKKFIAPTGTSGKFDKILGYVLREMINSTHGEKRFILLTGDPGVGKTSFVKQLAKLLGLPLFTIDISKITEEYVYSTSNDITTHRINYINIPYTIEIKEKKLKKQFNPMEIKSENLITQLKEAKTIKLQGEQYLNQLRKDKNLHEAVKKYANLIKEIRKAYDSILFLDEFYKTYNETSKIISDNILKGKIINTPIPSNVYIIFGANLKDPDNRKIPLNHEFSLIDFNDLN